MTLYKITNQKDFMSKLLTHDCFDSFFLKEATIHSFVPFTIDGHINKAFFATEDIEDSPILSKEYILWKEIRSICFNLIKGKRTPTKFQFLLYADSTIFSFTSEDTNRFLKSSLIRNLLLNIRFEHGEMTLTTGVDYSEFTLDKEAEHLWDQELKNFLIKNAIDFE